MLSTFHIGRISLHSKGNVYYGRTSISLCKEQRCISYPFPLVPPHHPSLVHCSSVSRLLDRSAVRIDSYIASRTRPVRNCCIMST